MEKQNMQLDLGEVITLSIILIFRNILFLCFLSLSIPFFSVSVCPYSSICLAHHFRLAVCQSLLVSSDYFPFFFLLIFTLSPTLLLLNYILSYGLYLVCFVSVFYYFFLFLSLCLCLHPLSFSSHFCFFAPAQSQFHYLFSSFFVLLQFALIIRQVLTNRRS
jgi:hypothetical protein